MLPGMGIKLARVGIVLVFGCWHAADVGTGCNHECDAGNRLLQVSYV